MKRPCPGFTKGTLLQEDQQVHHADSSPNKKARIRTSSLTNTTTTTVSVPGSWVFVFGTPPGKTTSDIQHLDKLPRVWHPHCSPATPETTHIIGGQCFRTRHLVYSLDKEGCLRHHHKESPWTTSSSVLVSEEEEENDQKHCHNATTVNNTKLTNTTFSTLTSGHNHFAAIENTTGYLYTWGRTDHGKLGHQGSSSFDDSNSPNNNNNNTTPIRSLCERPQRVEGLLQNIPIQQVACGLYHTLALTKHHGHVFSWGAHVYGATGHALISPHTDSSHNNKNSLSSFLPRRIERLRALGRVVSIAAGQHESAAIVVVAAIDDNDERRNTKKHQNRTRRQLYTWGLALDGRLGHSSMTPQTSTTNEGPRASSVEQSFLDRETSKSTPRLVSALAEMDVQQVVCGDGYMMALTQSIPIPTKNGGGTTPASGLNTTQVWSWGKNDKGQCGILQGKHSKTEGDDTKCTSVVSIPTIVPNVHGISHIGCRVSCSWAITEKGEIYTWGSNEKGSIGHGIEESIIPHPRQLVVMKHHYVVSANIIQQGLTVVVDPSQSTTSASVPLRFQGMTNRRLDDKSTSDVSLLVDGALFHVHRDVLIQRCPYFRTMFESGMRESVENVVGLAGVQKHTVKLLLHYLYRHDVEKSLHAASLNDLLELYKLGDLYDMECLKQLCCDFAKNKFDVEQVCPFVQAAHINGCDGLREIGSKFIVENFRAVSQTNGFLQMSHDVLIDIVRGRDLK